MLASFRSFVAMLAIAVLPAVNAAGETLSLSANTATVELGTGSSQPIEIAAAPYPRLLNVDEQSANISIELIDREGHEASVENRLGRGSVEFLFLAANQDHRLRLVHTDGPGTAVAVNLQLTQLAPETALHWATLGLSLIHI